MRQQLSLGRWFIALLVLALIPGCEKSPKQARRELIEAGYSYSGRSFAEAIQQNDEAAVRLFLAGGMAPGTRVGGYTALEYAAGRPGLTAALLAAGADPNAAGGASTPLVEAAAQGDTSSVRQLLAAGARADQGDGTAYTPLMAAASGGSVAVVQQLLAAGAQVNVQSRLGRTPLGEARAGAHGAVVDLLLGAGADQALLGRDLAALMDPPRLMARAPAAYRVELETSAGAFAVEVQRAWAPRGADRFYNLVKYGFFDHQRFFRVVPGRLVQLGLHGTPEVAGRWYEATIADDPAVLANQRGTLAFAAGDAPASRSTQIFVNLRDNPQFDRLGFVPFARVIEPGMDVVDSIYDVYGDTPEQERLLREGNAYLVRHFPRLDSVATARLGVD